MLQPREAGRTGEGRREPGAGGAWGLRVRALRDRRDVRRRKGALQEGAMTAQAKSECRPALGKKPWKTRAGELRAGSAVPWSKIRSSQSQPGDVDKPLKLLRASVSSSVQKNICRCFKSFLLR